MSICNLLTLEAVILSRLAHPIETRAWCANNNYDVNSMSCDLVGGRHKYNAVPLRVYVSSLRHIVAGHDDKHARKKKTRPRV
jgi:hypothetical protein